MAQKDYKKESITLWGAVGMGTGVMLGAAIFAVLGQVAELAGNLLTFSYIGGAIIAACSAYAYIKMSNSYPSAGGIGMFFVKVYGKGTITASSALLMAFSMVLSQSLIARTFGTYTLQLFNIGPNSWLVPALGVGLLIFAFLVNISKNYFIETFTSVISLIKIVGLAIFSFAALMAAGFSLGVFSKIFLGVAPQTIPSQPGLGLAASFALALLSFKGFTTITNSGAEIVKPHKNVGKAIIISIAILAALYLFIALAVSSSLSVPEIVAAKDYALAAAASPTLGIYGLWFTVGIAILATVTVCIGSLFAVSRLTAMLSKMKLIPHSHLGMKGTVQKHMLVYLLVIGSILTILFNLSRIASIGAIFYLVMDIIFQWGVLKRIKEDVNAKASIITVAIVLDIIALSAFIWMKIQTDILIVILAVILIIIIFMGEQYFLKSYLSKE
ncbi:MULTISPECIES: APC family permease [Methanobacterium]|uniref:Amino acid permease n=1 Tax=Methanobacterium bryantii TaxID=2161 RepID=A0A2A2H6D4_METBR|nr:MULTISPECIES: APC family permease [Methanobacterium]OEC85873.1 amino acid permease [Methanobacterium sp. A39]PAV04972.1 amino acid permease [Methanobacterium bryantii]